MLAAPQNGPQTVMSDPPEYELTLYPSPILRKAAQEVPAFDEALRQTVAGMLARMTASNGVGLAAPQVGLKQRILVLNPTGEPEDELVLVNPKLVARTGPKTTHEEGCLSFPGIYADVERPERCTIEAFDVAGQPIKAEYEGFVSRIVQHEYDHLEGVLLVDRMSPADKLRHKAVLQDLVEDYKEAREKKKAAAGRTP
jgi:peptide deformylase